MDFLNEDHLHGAGKFEGGKRHATNRKFELSFVEVEIEKTEKSVSEAETTITLGNEGTSQFNDNFAAFFTKVLSTGV